MKITKEVIATYKIELSQEDYEQLILAAETALERVQALNPEDRGARYSHSKFRYLIDTLKGAQ